jgi:hypothetical protein
MAADHVKAQPSKGQAKDASNASDAGGSQLASSAYWASVGSTIGLFLYLGWLA